MKKQFLPVILAILMSGFTVIVSAQGNMSGPGAEQQENAVASEEKKMLTGIEGIKNQLNSTPIQAESIQNERKDSVSYVVVTGMDVRIRKAPSTGSEILGYASSGERFEFLGESGDFSTVRLQNGEVAYISSRYVKRLAAQTAGDVSGAVSSSQKIGAMTGQGVFVRKSPSPSGEKIHDVLYGARFIYLEERDGYIKARFEDGVTGWVPKKYTTMTDRELIEGPVYSDEALEKAYSDFKRSYEAYCKTRSAASYDEFKKIYFRYRELAKKSPDYARLVRNPELTRIVVDKSTFTATVYCGNKPVRAFPIAYGSNPDGKTKQARGDCRTPEGDFRILYKEPRSYEGVATRAMWLDTRWGDIGLHGTPFPDSIGSKASHGCIRMYSQDAIELYRIVRIGTPVSIRGNAKEPV